MSVILKVVQIGNSKGIRLPKPLLEQCGIKKEVEIEAIDGALVLRPIRKHRMEWEAAFQEMSKKGDDQLLDVTLSNSFDDGEWIWK
jgi:antitoxin MazE